MKTPHTELARAEATDAGVSTGFAHAGTMSPSAQPQIATSNENVSAGPELTQIDSDASDEPAGSCCGGSCGTPLPRKPVTTEFVDGHCESCGKTSQFPADRDGKIEECPHCHEFLDVGELDWEITDFGEPLD